MSRAVKTVHVLTELGLHEHLVKAFPKLDFVCVDHLKPDKEVKLCLQDAEVLITDPDLLKPHLYDLPKAKWVQSTWAGIDFLGSGTFLNPAKPHPSFTFTRLGGAFGPVMADYVVGYMIAYERHYKHLWEIQKEKKWDDSKSYRSMSQLSIGILGAGDIGSCIAKYCKGIEMTVWGMIRRNLPETTKLPYIDHHRSTSGLAEILQNCDFICNVLPSTPETKGLLSGDVFQNCKLKKPVFINVGRGNITDEESLLRALREGWLSGAVLDVFETEPLPPNSPLWSHPQVTITPHISGKTFPHMVEDIFAKNKALYEAGEKLLFQIDWNSTY